MGGEIIMDELTKELMIQAEIEALDWNMSNDIYNEYVQEIYESYE